MTELVSSQLPYPRISRITFIALNQKKNVQLYNVEYKTITKVVHENVSQGCYKVRQFYSKEITKPLKKF